MTIKNNDFEQVFREELQTLGVEAGAETQPSTRHGLAGLAFSGGGIRSATFNLGVLMGLRKAGVLRHIDYLSTVSGGGFIGSCLSNMIRQDTLSELIGPAPDEAGDHTDRDRRAPAGGEGRMLTYLRNHSSYLADDGLGWVRIVGLLIQGILVNVLLLLPVILAAAGVCALITTSKVYEYQPIPYLFTAAATALWLGLAVLSPWLSQFGGRAWHDALDSLAGKFLLMIPIAAVVESQPYLLHWVHGWSYEQLGGVSSGMLAAGLLGAARFGNALGKYGSKLGLLLAALIGVLLPFSLYLPAAVMAAYPPAMLDLPMWAPAVGCLVAALLLYALFTTVDVNTTSVHGFYRDRLTNAYLVHLGDDLRVAHDVKLSQLPVRPYHLINTTMNLQGSRDESLRERNSDFFVFSPRHVGSERTGYVSTSQLEALVPDFSVGSAVAISGAAASPNMGTYTNRALVMIMAMLNVRLGYWLPNPASMKRRRPGVGFFYRELTSNLDAQAAFVSVSDGGHLENEGVYQLLRRRCRFIILGDGAADPRGDFTSLAELMRLAHIDLGVHIDIDVSAIRPIDGHSREACALGVIRYPARDGMAAELGFLLYIRAAVTGQENVVIENYRATNLDFPHQSTGDQFFDEAQFEAYRALGEHIVDQVLYRNRSLFAAGPISQLDFQSLFPSLAVLLADRGKHHGSALEPEVLLDRIHQTLSQREHHPYYLELYPETPIADRSEVPAAHMIRYQSIIESQLSLMEHVLERENLDRADALVDEAQRGWFNLFGRWARSNTFRRGWLHLVAARTTRLQIFGREHLGLEDFLCWRAHDLDDDSTGANGVPANYLPPELCPDAATLEHHAAAKRMRLLYSIELGPASDLFARPESCREFHTTVIGYALMREGRVEWLRLRTGYQGVYFCQRAIASLRAWAPDLSGCAEVIPVEMQGWVATDLCTHEDPNTDELRAAHDKWSRGAALASIDAATSSVPSLQPTSFVQSWDDAAEDDAAEDDAGAH